MSQIPRGYVLNTNQELQNLYEKVVDKCIELKLFNDKPRLFLFKSTTKWGQVRYNQRCTYEGFNGWKNKYSYTVHNQPIVALNSIFLKEPKKALTTICHELAHIATNEYCIRNNYRPEHHSDTFYSYYRTIGQKFGMTYNQFTRTNSNEEIGLNLSESKGKPHYEVYCNHCHRIVTREKNCDIIQHPEKWLCGVCGNHLSATKDFSQPADTTPVQKPKIEHEELLKDYIGKTIYLYTQYDGGRIRKGRLSSMYKGKDAFGHDNIFIEMIPTKCRKVQKFGQLDISSFLITNEYIEHPSLNWNNFPDDWFKTQKDNKNVIFYNY